MKIVKITLIIALLSVGIYSNVVAMEGDIIIEMPIEEISTELKSLNIK